MSNEMDVRNSNNELSTDINTITAEINAYQRVAGEAIFEIGRRLKHVKENDLVHGEWTKWCEAEVGIDRSTGNKFIRVYEELAENVGTYPRLGLRALYEIATLPPEARESEHVTAKGETKTPDEMTVRELREVKRQLKEREKEAEQAKEQAQRFEGMSKAERKERERLERENEELSNKEPEIRYETRTEYIEVVDEDIEKELNTFKDKFGDLKNYDDRFTATNRQEMVVSLNSFNKNVRDLSKRYSYLKNYESLISVMEEYRVEQYNEAVRALKSMADEFEEIGVKETITIN